eukprot:TRINITY_DN598_c0_g1_i2.p1 TRINITY_DN598_c0_g1~~TRINITY_DN598_c0_g1_i2.p1  ORF type:complete len:144 (-),score=18.75 TRINITY_DN598_c0_g1_i2:101-496(-)
MSGRGNAPDISGLISVKVSNIDRESNADSLREAFEKYGTIGDVFVPRDNYTMRNRGFGFVRFKNKEDAEDAISDADGRLEIDGARINCEIARYGRNERPRRRYSPGRGRDRRSRSRSYGRRRHSRSRSSRR